MSITSLSSLFAQKSWANNELFNVLATVDAASHPEVVDRIFQAHLLGEPHGYRATNTEATPELGTLQFEVAETDGWYEAYVAQLSEAQLAERIHFSFTDGDGGTMSREEMLTHIVVHGFYHRGNVGQMLKSIEVAPPRDLYTKFLHLREPERRG